MISRLIHYIESLNEEINKHTHMLFIILSRKLNLEGLKMERAREREISPRDSQDRIAVTVAVAHRQRACNGVRDVYTTLRSRCRWLW